MARKRFTTEQIIHKIRSAEVEIAKGKLIPEACRQIGVALRSRVLLAHVLVAIDILCSVGGACAVLLFCLCANAG